MNHKQLETFIWVATLGSFRKTAVRLFTTQPAISSRIAKLEESLGVKLFERHSGSISLTAKGQQLLPFAEKLILMADRLKEEACGTETSSGVLRLGVSETIVHTWLSDFLSSVHHTFPRIDLDITIDVTANLRNELVSRSMDLAFLLGPISDYSIANIDLCSYPLIWAGSPALKLPQGRLPIDVLARRSIITYARNTRPFAEINAFLKGQVVEPARIFPSSSLAACKRMAVDGIGIGSLPMSCIGEEIAQGRLAVIPSTWAPSDLVFTASYSREPHDPLTAKIALLARAVAQAHGETSDNNYLSDLPTYFD